METGALIDNLTYTIAPASNRLNSIADAVGVTAETWDAEAGSFTYDANGNQLTAPGPYSITATTYDPRNLPLSITMRRDDHELPLRRRGAADHEAGRAGNTEVYVKEGTTTLGVFTVNAGGTVTSSYFNLLAGDRVVGRQPNAGSRSYYHTDLLGSTRSVVQGVTITESYDPDPWGVLMPGRTLGSGTKEGFTSKERDAESQMDYFGARYYLAAVGRWGSVDPAPYADRWPQWTPYQYGRDDPARQVDGLGLCVSKDRNCEYLVRFLRQQRGKEFKLAADRFDAQKTGRVYFYSRDMSPTRGDARKVDGDPKTYRLGSTRDKGGDVFLRGDISAADFLVTAVHESVHLAGEPGETVPTYAAYRAFRQLSPAERTQAIFNANSFYVLWGDRYGVPLSARITEPRIQQRYFVPPVDPQER